MVKEDGSMTRQKVTDPNLLSQLGQSARQKVTDPNLLVQLNSEEYPEDTGAYLDNLPPPEGFFKKLPRNSLIGLAKLGHSTLNLPHDAASLAQSGINKLSGSNLKLADYIPKQQDYDFAQMLGQKDQGTIMDNLIQGGIEYFPQIMGGRGLLSAGARRLTGAHQLESVGKAAEQFGNNFSFSPGLAGEAQKYLPKTEATRQLLSKSNAGEYPASFSLRSQLGKHQRDLSKSPLAAERLLAPELGDLRKNMLGELDKALRSQGLHDEADTLQKGIKNYAQYMRVKQAAMPVIKKLGIPTSIAAGIGFGYKKGKNLVTDY